MSRFGFEHHPDSPFIWFNIKYGEDSERLQMHWGNTVVYHHRGEYKKYDHVFVETPSDEPIPPGQGNGVFIFREILSDFSDLVNGLITHDYPAIHNPLPAIADMQAYKLLYPDRTEEVNRDIMRVSELGKKLGNFVLPEPQMIVEAEDENIVIQAMENIDAEIDYFFGEYE